MSSSQIFPAALRAKNAAQYLGIGVSTFWQWVKEGRIPTGTKLSPRCTVWKRETLDQFLANQASR